MTQYKPKNTLSRVLRRLTASLLCCATLATAAFALNGKVDTASLNVRSETSIKSASMGKIYKDQEVEITGRLGNWYSIDYNGKRGFVFVDYLDADTYYPVDISYGTVTASSEKSTVNLREKPSTDSDRLTRLLYGTKVRILGYIKGWYYVRYVDYYGYISADYLNLSNLVYSNPLGEDETIVDLSLTEDLPKSSSAASLVDTWEPAAELLQSVSAKPQTEVTTETAPAATTTAVATTAAATTTAKPVATTTTTVKATTKATTTTAAATTTAAPKTNTSLRQQIVDYAKKFLGVKYVFGGTSPSTGFDCSGLTQYVYKHFGYSINRLSYDQIHNGTKITKSQLQPGDLVFFSRSGYSVGHVGIYIGNGQFIHAPRSGDVVKISSLNESYYVKNYVGARRIIND